MKSSFITFAALFLYLMPQSVRAVSATWNVEPISGDWNIAANWTPAGVPDGPADVATFGVSNVTEVIPDTFVTLGAIVFAPGASSYNISFQAFNGFNFNDAGITNNSGVAQRITASYNISFFGHSTAGSDIVYTTTGTSFTNVTNQIGFLDSADAGSATFINNGSGSAGLSGYIYFADATSAAHSFITNNGPAGFFDKPTTLFYGNSTAANGTLVFNDGSIGYFQEKATAADSDITSYSGSTVFFWQTSTAGAATLHANGGYFHFQGTSDGGTARLILSNAGSLFVDATKHNVPFALGSLEGDGSASSDRPLQLGGNNLDTTYSGFLFTDLVGDWLTKVGTGTLTLAAGSEFAANTTVVAGALIVTNTIGSATGMGVVKVNAGTLGGSGIIAGAVTVGTGSGSGAFLAPAHGGKKPLTLTIQSNLTFNSDATYTYTFKAKAKKSKIDKVVANGVTINSGAKVNLSGTTQGPLTPGATLTLIKNTAATPIVGTFSNLPDGGIVTVNGNNFQVSYAGGDGNDLTLTVVP